jgi:hypothetical protein
LLLLLFDVFSCPNITTPSFKPTHCKEDCTFDAVVETQLDKFKEFRTYLSELLANRPGNI